MQNLVFKQLTIMSKIEKAAVTLNWSAGTNVLTGKNDVGKSTAVKALYHTLGADVPQMNNKRWSKAKAIYFVEFQVDRTTYSVLRDGKTFAVFDSNRILIARYRGVGGERGIGSWINQLFNFQIELETKAEEVVRAWPALYLLPFYVDQDEGWTQSWASFSSLAAFKNYRRKMIDYHLGVRPQAYYDTLKDRVGADKELLEVQSKLGSLIEVRRTYVDRKVQLRTDIDRDAFKAEIEELVKRMNELQGRQQAKLSSVKDVRNELADLDLEISVLERSIRELQADFDFAADPETPDDVSCPTCGAHYHNSIKERFHIIDDVDQCFVLIDERRTKKIDVQDRLLPLEREYAALTKEVLNLDELLRREKHNVRFEELVRAEGYKDVLRSIDGDILAVSESVQKLQETRDALAAQLRNFSKSKAISDFYADVMKQYLNALNVHTLAEEDYSDPHKVIKNDVLGSDLPRALLAQVFAYLRVMEKFGDFVLCPMVIDTPFQQEQDDQNAMAIWRFVLGSILKGQQLIVATVEYDAARLGREGVSIIELPEQYALLQAGQYQGVASWLIPMHDAALRT